MITYAQAETILARLYSADPDVQRRTFRARLKHLKRLGVPLGVNPGRGSKVLYEEEHLFQWAWCLELEEFGVDPNIIVSILKDFSGYIIGVIFRKALRAPVVEGLDLFLYFHPTFMSQSWATRDAARKSSPPSKVISPWTGEIRLGAPGDILDALHGGQRRLCVINLSKVAQQIHQGVRHVSSEKVKTGRT